MRAFIIRGFGIKQDSGGSTIDFEAVDQQLITPAIMRCGLVGGTTAEVVEAGNIRADMFELIIAADVVICDITIHNANVFYELGVRHALRKKHTVLIKGDCSADKTPFDLSTDRYLKYPSSDPCQAVDGLVAAIQASLTGPRETDSPIFLMLPTLPEAKASEIVIVPLDFVDDVNLAFAAHDKGWLRLLAEDVRGERFERDGLKLVARAQWRLKDYFAARDNWEQLRGFDRTDLEANLALANIYERLYSLKNESVLLERSNQAVETILSREGLDAGNRAEALALKGRNLKSLWRRDFEDLDSYEGRREQAIDSRLLSSYEAYKEAFFSDLNSFYPGLAALQMAFVLSSLSEQRSWPSLFRRDPVKARRYAEDLESEIASLKTIVSKSIELAMQRLEGGALTWARISDADLMFLTEGETSIAADPGAVVSAYRSAIPRNDRFAADAVRRQLDLYRSLGIRVEAANAVIDSIGAVNDSTLPTHLVVFSGHVIDGQGRSTPRFPVASEAKARHLVESRLKRQIQKGEKLVVLALAAPGADILAHEICDELGVQSFLCLPMDVEVIAREVFKDHDDWLSRFHKIVRAREGKTLRLGSDTELPRWLLNRDVDPWERGNRWVVNLALSWGAARVTLIALWDHDEEDPSVSGTAQIVRLARSTGNFELDYIDSRTLLSQQA